MHAYRPNHYEALGVPRHADAEAIRTAYRGLAKQLHPDLSDGGSRESQQAFLRLQEAYDVLRDPGRRADYDNELARRAARAQAAAELPPRRERPALRISGLGGFLAAIGLVVIVTAGIATWQLSRPQPQPTIIVKAEPVDRGRPARGAGSGGPEPTPDRATVTRNIDRPVQVQAEKVDTAQDRMTYKDADAAYKKGDYATALRGLRLLADEGNADAQYRLARMYESGEGVPKNPAAARAWYRKAAEQGRADAQQLMGFIYDDGMGVPQDHEAAVSWFRRAADQGDSVSQYTLAQKYILGEGVARDVVQAHKWLSLAATDAKMAVVAAKSRDSLVREMAPAQVAEAQKLAREWKPRPER